MDLGQVTLIIMICLTSCWSMEAVNNKTDKGHRTEKTLSVFNVVTFPNSACGASTGYNGTCYTASECTSKGGTASGSCASGFGMCCVFDLACGSSTTENNTYAIISSYSTSSDADPCSYTICKQNSNVCKIRLDFDTMVLAPPYTTTSSAVNDGPRVGDCLYDTLTVSNPGGSSPPIICGYNTNQHMFVPASPSCNTINIDIDTATTTTTRSWQIKVTQYECGNLRAPEQDCLQYFTGLSGTVATFNWDTSATTTVSASQAHLSSQYYDICFRRERSYCSLCLSPQIVGTGANIATSFGLGSSSDATDIKSAFGVTCTGVTSQAPTSTGYGDFIEVQNFQPSIGTAGTVSTTTKICGPVFAAISTATIATETACSFVAPFKIGVHFDDGEVLVNPPATGNYNKGENIASGSITAGDGYGYSGFWLAYWLNAC